MFLAIICLLPRLPIKITSLDVSIRLKRKKININ
nr:MAG TPA: hypothetical protein [Caudoviricetes sp.]DAV48825.1 MAG TPA: hypothetical protein [Caudoviricetes sp.]